MNELINVSYDSEQPTVLGRDLHEALKINTPYHKWFPRMCEYGFEEHKDFVVTDKNVHNSNGGKQNLIDDLLTIPMAKEICMIQRTDIGKQYRQYFINLENQWNTPEAVMARALKFANSKIDDLRNVNLTLTAKIEEEKPKVIFADAVATAKTSILIGDLAKLIKQNGVDIGQKRLFKWLRENGYLIKREGSDHNMPTQKSMDMGLFEVKETAITHSDGHVSVNKTPKVTGKGQQYFINKFLSNAEE